jgi:hypothetical protein
VKILVAELLSLDYVQRRKMGVSSRKMGVFSTCLSSNHRWRFFAWTLFNQINDNYLNKLLYDVRWDIKISIILHAIRSKLSCQLPRR